MKTRFTLVLAGVVLGVSVAGPALAAGLTLEAEDTAEAIIDGRPCLIIDKTVTLSSGAQGVEYCLAEVPLVIEGVPDSTYGDLRFDVMPLSARHDEDKLARRIGTYTAAVVGNHHLDLTGAIQNAGQDAVRIAAFLGDFESSATNMSIRFGGNKAAGSGQLMFVTRKSDRPAGGSGVVRPNSRESTVAAEAAPVLAYPNPLRNKIKLVVPDKAADCDEGIVSIFDARGRRVRDIVGTVTSANGVTWQGDDALGKRVSGGVYFWVQSCRDGVDWSPRYRGKISLLR